MQKPIMKKYEGESEKVERAIEEIKNSEKSFLENKLWTIYGYLQDIINSRDVTKENDEIKKIGYRRLHFEEWWKNEKEQNHPRIKRT